MDGADKLELLAGGARYDLSCACGTSGARVRGPDGRWVFPAALPDGRTVRMLKVLMSNACVNDCAFCAQRQGGVAPRSRFKPEELATQFMNMYRREKLTGLFLSSAVDGDTDRSMEQMLRTLELLRFRHGYRGWLHCKIMPGASREQVERAARLATRLSVNLEAASAAGLKAIAPRKSFREDIMERVGWISELVRRGDIRCRGQTSQFIVGAGPDTDEGFIRRAADLYGRLGLSRVYFSAFQPVPGTPLEGRPAASFEREHRLYQADFLLRKYGFGVDELYFDDGGALPLADDPKSIWAQRHPELFPVEINRAPRDRLLRVPGIGPVIADRVVAARREGKLRDAAAIAALGVPLGRSAPFLLIDGRRADKAAGSQLALWHDR